MAGWGRRGVVITHVREHAARGPSYASGGEPGWTEVRWDCDGCDFSGEWDDMLFRADGFPLDEPEEGDAAYCRWCRDRMEDDDD